MAAISAMSATAGAVQDILEGKLPYKAWIPWTCNSFLIFFFISLQEIIAVLIGTVLNIATETTLFGFCMQICAQLEILKHRLQKIASEEKEISTKLYNTSNKTNRLSEHIVHHLCIIRFVKQVVKIFYVNNLQTRIYCSFE